MEFQAERLRYGARLAVAQDGKGRSILEVSGAHWDRGTIAARSPYSLKEKRGKRSPSGTR
jgi:hypothetical protein